MPGHTIACEDHRLRAYVTALGFSSAVTLLAVAGFAGISQASPVDGPSQQAVGGAIDTIRLSTTQLLAIVGPVLATMAGAVAIMWRSSQQYTTKLEERIGTYLTLQTKQMEVMTVFTSRLDQIDKTIARADDAWMAALRDYTARQSDEHRGLATQLGTTHQFLTTSLTAQMAVLDTLQAYLLSRVNEREPVVHAGRVAPVRRENPGAT